MTCHFSSTSSQHLPAYIALIITCGFSPSTLKSKRQRNFQRV
nr:MAG TPA: hypothetical protein [Caudoviricetes sp.]